MIDIQSIRNDFPILKKTINGYPLIYFDSAATSQKPFQVVEAMSRFYLEEYGTVHRAVYSLAANATMRHFEARRKIQKFICAKEQEEILFIKGTTEGINLLANGLGKKWIGSGDEVLLVETEHHANLLPWQNICREKGAHLKAIPVDDNGEIIWDAFLNLLTDRTKILALAHITNTTGSQYPIEEMIALAHGKGALVVIDAAQSIAHIPMDVQKLDADFVVFSAHKMYGPTGVGVLYGKKELLMQMDPYQFGGDMIEKVTFDSASYQLPPLRFEAGTPAIAECIGLGAAIDYIEEIGREEIAKYESMLTEYASEKMRAIPGLKIMGNAASKGSIISFVIEGIHPLDIGTLLDCKGIAIRTGHLCSQTTMQRFGVSSFCRISFGIYNTKEEIDQFILYLEEICKSLCHCNS